MTQESVDRHPPAPAATPPGLWRVMAGWSLWALALCVLYGGHALACRYAGAAAVASQPPDGVGGWLLVLWGVFIAGHIALTAGSWRRLRTVRASAPADPKGNRYTALLTCVLDASALCATVVTGLPVAVVPACVG